MDSSGGRRKPKGNKKMLKIGKRRLKIGLYSLTENVANFEVNEEKRSKKIGNGTAVFSYTIYT